MSDYDDDDGLDLVNQPTLNQVKSMINDLQAACNSLGKLDQNDGTYMKDRDCKSCLKEILRILNNDTKQHDVRIMLGKLDIVKNDLIPLMNQYCDYNEGDTDLFNLIMRLCTNITASALLLFEHQEVPTEPDSMKVYNQIMAGLTSYKIAFANDTKIWMTLNTHLRHTDDEIPFERLLILIRNILHIPVDTSADQGIKSGFDAHELCLQRMDQSGLLQTIIQIAAEEKKGMDFCFHVIEIIYLMLRDQNPVTVANAKPNATKRKLDDTDADSQRLAELAAREKRERSMQQKKQLYNPRFKHSTFVIQNLHSIGNRPVTTSHIIGSRENMSFDHLKTDLRKSKNRKPLSSEANSAVISDRNIKSSRITYSLKVFSKMFVEKVYSNYMHQIKHNLIQKKAAEDDESYYLWSIQYFTSFNRHLGLSLDFISETMSTSSLHFIQILITTYQEKLKLEKKRSVAAKISKRLHLAVRAYREILNLIRSIENGSELQDVIEQIKRNIMSETEYNSLILTLFQQYDSAKHCREFLNDLIEANHVFLELQAEQSNEFVQRYCTPDIISVYLEALRNFRVQDDAFNLKILKFFERIAYDCKSDVLLMQASLLRCLLEVHDFSGQSGFTALIKHIMANFGDMIHKKRWMMQELLFWKKQDDVVEIEMAIDPPKDLPVAASPSGSQQGADEDALLETQDDQQLSQSARQQQPPGDSIEDLMAELGSDSDDGDDNDEALPSPQPSPQSAPLQSPESPQASSRPPARLESSSPEYSPLPSPLSGESPPPPQPTGDSPVPMLDSSPDNSPPASPRPVSPTTDSPLRSLLESSSSDESSASPPRQPLPVSDDSVPPRLESSSPENSPTVSPLPSPSPVPSLSGSSSPVNEPPSPPPPPVLSDLPDEHSANGE